MTLQIVDPNAQQPQQPQPTPDAGQQQPIALPSTPPPATPTISPEEQEYQKAIGEADKSGNYGPPPPPVPGADASEDYAQQQQQGQKQSEHDDYMQLIGGGEGDRQTAQQGPATGNAAGATQGEEPPIAEGGQQKPGAPKKKEVSKSWLLDFAHGIGEAEPAVAGAILNAFDATAKLAEETGQAIAKHLPKGTPYAYDSKQGRLIDVDEYNEARKTDPIEEHGKHIKLQTATGEAIRGMAQFVVGFQTGGAIMKMTALPLAYGAGFPAVSKGALAIQGMAKGAFSDFTVFEGHSKNLANFLGDNIGFIKPVTDLLATSPSDSEAEGRFKNTLMGLGLGVGTEGLIYGFTKALRFMQKSGGSAAFGEWMKKWLGVGEPAFAEIQEHELVHLGDPNADLFTKRAAEKIEEGTKATEGIKPSDTRGRLKSGPEYDINFAAINTQDDVKTVMRKMAQREKEGIEAGKRSTEMGRDGELVRSHETTKAAADQLDAFDIIVNRRQGETLNAEEIVSARRFYIASAEKLRAMAKLAAEIATPANLALFEKMAAIHVMVQKEVLNAGSEIARAMNAMQIPVGSSKQLADQVSSLLEQASGGGVYSLIKAQKIAKLASAGNQAAIDKFVEGTIWKKGSDAIAQAFVNGLLSPATVTVKLVSDMVNAAQQVQQRKVAEHISAVLGTEGGVVMGESLSMASAAITAFKEAFVAVAQQTKQVDNPMNFIKMYEAMEKGIEQTTKNLKGAIPFELPQTGKIAAQNWNINQSGYLAKALDTIDLGTRVPSRMISTVDQFSKMMGYRMELHAQALRQATGELKGGMIAEGQLQKRIAEIIQDPPKNIQVASVDQAMYQTFTAKPAEAFAKLGNAIQNFPIIGRVLLPFKNTPINIFTQAFEATPLAPLIKTWRADLMAGGARADIALARMSGGTAMLQIGMDLSFQGIITGRGPQHVGERANWEANGNMSYGFHIPGTNTRVAYHRLDPLGFTLGLGADIAEMIVNAEHDVAERDFTRVMTGAAFSIGNNVLSKTYMMGTSEFINAVSNPDRRGAAYVQHLLGSLTPSTVKTVTRTVDPYSRAADGMIDSMQRTMPYFSKGLPLIRNIWGEEKSFRSPAGALYDAFSPYWLTSKEVHPVDKELQRLKYYPQMPPKTVNVGGGPIPMTAAQYSRYVELAGNELKDPAHHKMGCRDYLNSVIDGNSSQSHLYKKFGEMDDKAVAGVTDRQKTFIENTIRDYRKKAGDRIMHEDTDMQGKYNEKNAGKPLGRVPAAKRFKFIQD